MPIPEQRDLEEARGILAAWFADDLGATDVEVGPIEGPALTGFSNETLLFDIDVHEAAGSAGTEGLVVRVKPTAHTVFLESDFEWQYQVLDLLGTKTDVPVPVVRGFEADPSILGAPFFVMERIDNCRVPADSPPYTVGGWIHDEATPEQRRTLVESGIDALVKVHALDWRALGLDFLDKPQYGDARHRAADPLLRSRVRVGRRGRGAAGHRSGRSTGSDANAPVVDPEITVCWGDARINNQLFDADYHVRAVLDWEMVTLADPMMDLGWWLFLDRHFHEGASRPRLEGFPTREEMVVRYEEKSRRVAHDLEFYEVFAAFRFAVVMMRIKSLLVEFELMPRRQRHGPQQHRHAPPRRDARAAEAGRAARSHGPEE